MNNDNIKNTTKSTYNIKSLEKWALSRLVEVSLFSALSGKKNNVYWSVLSSFIGLYLLETTGNIFSGKESGFFFWSYRLWQSFNTLLYFTGHCVMDIWKGPSFQNNRQWQVFFKVTGLEKVGWKYYHLLL